MSDPDPCECIWNHEMAMRRLLSLLRSSQSYCTETACYEDGTGPQNNQPDNILMFSILFLAGLLLYYFRPTQGRIEAPTKPTGGNDTNDPPPPATI